MTYSGGNRFRRPRGSTLSVDYFFDRSIPEPNSGCWIWLNAISERTGYGALRVAGITKRAHRTCFEVATGSDAPKGLDVCHTCDVRCCVNPDHLFLGTRKDNMEDCAKKGRIKLPGLCGEDCSHAVLSDSEVLAIRASVGQSQRALARRYGVDKGTIAHILHRKTWRHI